jgi:hypothetical protein
MRRSKVLAILLAPLLALAVVAPAAAITNGTPDGDDHPYVGFLVVYVDVEGVEKPAWSCTSALLSPTVILTAGHCVAGGDAVRAWFQSDVTGVDISGGPGSGAFEAASWTTFPGWESPARPGGRHVDSADFAVVTLGQAVPTSQVGRYAQLPTAGLTDTLATGAPIDLVGWGAQYKDKIPGPPFGRWSGDSLRQVAPSTMGSNTFDGSDNFIQIAMNASQGTGGICIGDSGGPNLLGGTDVVLANTTLGNNANCAGVGYGTRIDLPERLAWIRTFLD